MHSCPVKRIPCWMIGQKMKWKHKKEKQKITQVGKHFLAWSKIQLNKMWLCPPPSPSYRPIFLVGHPKTTTTICNSLEIRKCEVFSFLLFSWKIIFVFCKLHTFENRDWLSLKRFEPELSLSLGSSGLDIALIDWNTFYCPFTGAKTPLKKRRYIHLQLAFSSPFVWYSLFKTLFYY